MNYVKRTITLTSDLHFGRRIPSTALGIVLETISESVVRSVSMAFRGRSAVDGPLPSRIEAAADIRFMEHRGADESTLVFEIPTLGEALNELYDPHKNRRSLPDPDQTGFELLAKVVGEVAANNIDSDHYDRNMLKYLIKFRFALKRSFREIRFDTTDASESAATIDSHWIEIAREIRSSTPPPRRVRIVGTLDMLRVSTQGFELRLDDGERVPGVLLKGSIVDVAEVLNRRVMIVGRAIYRASGRILRIDADSIAITDSTSSVWTKIPAPAASRSELRRSAAERRSRNGAATLIGSWPGDESDQEIDRALEEIG